VFANFSDVNTPFMADFKHYVSEFGVGKRCAE
jgi:hypothetical protein